MRVTHLAALAGLITRLGSSLTLTARWRPLVRAHAHRRSVACNAGTDDGAESGFDSWGAWDAAAFPEPYLPERTPPDENNWNRWDMPEPYSPEPTPPDDDDWNRWDKRGATSAIEAKKSAKTAAALSKPPPYDEDALNTANYERVLRQVTDNRLVTKRMRKEAHTHEPACAVVCP